MKKLLVLIYMLFFCKSGLLSQGYKLLLINKSSIPVEILSYVYEIDSLNVNQQHVQTDSLGFFWYANKKTRVDFMCTQNDKKADNADVRWKYTGAFGIKTPWHTLTIRPLNGIYLFYIFKDGLIAINNVTSNLWQYKRVPVELISGVPLLKNAIVEQNFTKEQFIDELARVARRVGEKVPKNPFVLSTSLQNALKEGTCPVQE